jgi:HAD superfamily hydrolase (TIGR01484 family)
MIKHFFFDLDNTLTPSRQPMLPEHRTVFVEFCKAYDVIGVSGQELASFCSQLPVEAVGTYYVLAQVGNHAYDLNGEIMWQETPSEEQTQMVLDFVAKLRSAYPREVKDENDIIELRGSLIGYSLIGHHEDPEKKAALDPGSVLRKKMLAHFADEVARLREAGIDVSPAGTTTIEFFLAGRNKGFNIKRFIDFKKWSGEESVYVGDELESGRNDESVIGVIPTHAVTDPDDTFAYIASVLI